MTSRSISHEVVDVGTPQSNIQEWAITEIRFNGFEDLPPLEYISSPEFINSGFRWKLSLKPRAHPSTETEIRVHYLDLTCSIDIDMRLGIKGENDDDWGERHITTSRGVNFLFSRSKVLESLVNGALVIEFQTMLNKSGKNTTALFIPENPAGKAIPQMFMDESTADVVFEVGQKKGNCRAKKKVRRAESQAQSFYAHRLILAKCAPTLSELFGLAKEGPDRIPISDIDAETFRHVLNYVYGGKISDDDLESRAEEIIDAADRYGVTSLKLEAEASLVRSTAFSLENVLERLLYADSKNCALLKEAAMDFIVRNKMEMLEHASLRDVPGGMFTDILAAVARAEREGVTGKDSDEDRFGAMRISELRRKVHERGLCIDGSREALIAQLKEKDGE